MLKLEIVNFDETKTPSVVEKEILDNMLKSYNITDYEIIYNKNGKPYIKNSSIYFSVSHSFNTIICALSNNEIGIDIEKIRDFDKTLDGNINMGKMNNMTFFKEWTKRQAYLKMMGLGLSDLYNTPVDIFVNTYIRNGYVISICEKPIINIKEEDKK